MRKIFRAGFEKFLFLFLFLPAIFNGCNEKILEPLFETFLLILCVVFIFNIIRAIVVAVGPGGAGILLTLIGIGIFILLIANMQVHC